MQSEILCCIPRRSAKAALLIVQVSLLCLALIIYNGGDIHLFTSFRIHGHLYVVQHLMQVRKVLFDRFVLRLLVMIIFVENIWVIIGIFIDLISVLRLAENFLVKRSFSRNASAGINQIIFCFRFL